ncbi:MAG: nucleotidyl transferase AbiEii/AbiGii toxin family protein [Actinomycetia bacterium]|nr:nucleotidyl transferase AbiEii/AbiGii toxin family protein [Actinomycetes bacterium]
MISERDLRARVAEWGLRDDVVEKDYVLGWILAGIGTEPVLRDGWVFKGGTCLKKCYLETFRFSEDLDFTVSENGPIVENEVLGHLDRMLERIGRESGIDFAVRERRLRVRPNGSLEGRIYYRGPRNAPNPASIRLDLTRDEQVARPPVMRPIQHLYSDQLPEPATVRCYSLEEVYAEKIRAMGERGRPRDLYDIVFLLDFPGLADSSVLISETLVAKCDSKGVPVPTLKLLQESPHRVELESEWANMLGHQLPALPPLDHYWDRLPELFGWLDGELEVEPAVPVAGGAGERVWAPSPAAWSWGSGPALEPVRFAGANRLCVDLGYGGTVRRVEPYSLRVTQDGNLLLYAVRRDNRQLRSYRVDRIQSIEITTEPFRPVHYVEFRPAGPLSAPPTTHRSAGGRGRSPTRPYRVECAVCGKTLARSRPGTRLKAHKDESGFPCPGRIGYQV